MLKIIKKRAYDQMVDEASAARALEVVLRKQIFDKDTTIESLTAELTKTKQMLADTAEKLKALAEDKKNKSLFAKKKWLKGEYGEKYEARKE